MYTKYELRQFLESLIGWDKDVEIEIDVAGAVIYRYNKEEKIPEILMIRRCEDDKYPNVWEFPRGKCTQREKIRDCMKREVKEETGLTLKIESYLNKFTYIADEGKRRSTQYNFLCKLDPPDQEVVLSKEHSEYRWISTKGQIDLLAYREIEDTLNAALERISTSNV